MYTYVFFSLDTIMLSVEQIPNDNAADKLPTAVTLCLAKH